jgi:hypothetical protein
MADNDAVKFGDEIDVRISDIESEFGFSLLQKKSQNQISQESERLSTKLLNAWSDSFRD